MARKDHGHKLLSLVLQPGSVFARTTAGFDTGTRTFRCDRSVSAKLCPEVHSADKTRRTMFVASAQINELANQIDEITVAYLGLINGRDKPASPIGDTNSESFVIQRYPLNEASPIVTFVSVQSTRPDPWEPGTNKTPAGYADTNGAATRSPYYNGLIIDLTIVFAGWVLQRRSSRRAGSLWEVTDTYEYLRVRAPIEEA